jgi:hypothetical protein
MEKIIFLILILVIFKCCNYQVVNDNFSTISTVDKNEKIDYAKDNYYMLLEMQNTVKSILENTEDLKISINDLNK